MSGAFSSTSRSSSATRRSAERSIKDASGPAVEFSGWLGLMSAFDRARLEARRRAAEENHADNEGSSVAP